MKIEFQNILLSFYKPDMELYLKNHPEAIDEAFKLAVLNEWPFSWRSAWLLSGSLKKNDKRIRKYIKEIIKVLPDRNDGHQRELLKLIEMAELNDENEGRVFDICMNLWEMPAKQPSVRVTAFRILLNIVKKHPELSSEIEFLTQEHYLETLSPGVRKSLLKMINKKKII